MVRRIDDLCARTPDGALVLATLAWLGGAIDAARAERATTGAEG
jgi:hypothetical protein